MRKLKIPMFQVDLYIYNTSEKAAYEKNRGSLPDDWYAVHDNGHIWIGENKGMDKIGTCYHEAVHFADWVLENRLESAFPSLRDSTELRAYMTQWAGDKVREYVMRGEG